MSHGISKLLKPLDDEELPPLQGEQDYHVVWCYPSGIKRIVVEREHNILSLAEARAHENECNKAMLDELTRWQHQGAFERTSKQHATNVIDARWARKWKEVDGKHIIQARIVVRGFKDPQAAQLSTLAGTTGILTVLDFRASRPHGG